MTDRVSYRAAGGVVVKADGSCLVLERPHRNEVRLPKGHVEPGETVEQAAVREVQEESGYADLEVVGDLGSLTHSFHNPIEQTDVTRTETYFLMRLRSDRSFDGPHYAYENFTPRWVTLAEAGQLLTYDSEREFIRRAIRYLNDQAGDGIIAHG
jgi:8-oxo-dGTP pyrophosphatase MutT (NUDIX family)